MPMILPAPSVWARHLTKGDAVLARRLRAGLVLGHPLVTGEIAMEPLRQRAEVLAALNALPSAVVASDTEVCDFIERATLHGLGLSYVDAHLLASARLTPTARLWTREPRLRAAAERLGAAFSP